MVARTITCLGGGRRSETLGLVPSAGKVVVGEQDLPGARPAPKEEEKIRDEPSRIHPWGVGCKPRRAVRSVGEFINGHSLPPTANVPVLLRSQRYDGERWPKLY